MYASCFEPGAARSPTRRGRRGFVLLFAGAMLILVLLPAIGMAVDMGVMYLVQSRLSAACDAASLAGARSLSRGADDSAQHANAESTAATYFHANFPAGYFASTNVVVNNVAATDSTFMRSVTTTSSVDLPYLFLRALGLSHATLQASAKSTRRDVNIMIVMDRSGSLANSGSCTPLKTAAVNFVQKFAEGRDNLGLVTFATSSRVDAPLATTFKTAVTNTLNGLVCTGATNSAQALWQSYVELAGLAQAGALNVIVFFTDGRPTAVTENFPIKSTSTCTPLHTAPPKLGVITLGSSTQGLYNWSAPAQPLASDITVISDRAGCSFKTGSETAVTSDISYAPLTDYWGNSLKPANAYLSVTTSGAGLSIASAQNVQNFSTNAADNAALRIRSGAADVNHANRTLAGVTIFSIGLGDVDDVLLKRVANDPSLSPNPVAAGNQGLYVYAANATQLDQAFTRVASEMLRLAR
jgi:Flp pilus assembly protein TadG